ncbi:MAG: 50S ribosomal protein L30 [Deltaproteobacteria bacterium]
MTGKTVKITLKKGKSGSTQRQRNVLIGLGLKKVNSTKVLNDTPAVRGMIYKVAHLVSVESAG